MNIYNTWFTILECNDEHTTLECNNCSEVFDINIDSLLNMYFDEESFAYLPLCPTCGQRGEY